MTKAKKVLRSTAGAKRRCAQPENKITQLQGLVTQLTQRLDNHAQLFDDQNDQILDLQEAICPKVAARLTALERRTDALTNFCDKQNYPTPESFMARLTALEKQYDYMHSTLNVVLQDERNNCLAIERVGQRLAAHIAEMDRKPEPAPEVQAVQANRQYARKYMDVVEAAKAYVARIAEPSREYAALYAAVKALK